MRLRAVRLGTGGLAALLVVTAVGWTGSRPAAAAEIIPTPASGVWTIDGHGNGHGHGMSQYGARGAAIAGLSAAQIIAFYYPGTRLVAAAQPTIRVAITDDGNATTVAVPAGQTLTLSWPGGKRSITSAGATRLRLIAAGTGVQPQYLHGTWTDWGGHVPTPADFSSSAGYVRTYHGDGSFSDYRGTVGAVRNAAGEITVNRLPLDQYVRGVVPREMPSSWQPAAVQAQAIAARSYARYAVEHNASGLYDICDTTNCQVYGGLARYDATGQRLYGEEPGSDAAVAATANQVATYNGSTIFAQFSASNGGMTSAGGQPYMVTKPDPYDNAASGDPYLNWTRTATAAQVASYYGLARVTQLQITGRAGGGQWGGIVTSAVVTGVTGSGQQQNISATGIGLANALGLPYQYFHIRPPSSVPDATSAAGGRVEVYYKGADGRLWRKWFPNSAWQGPVVLNAGLIGGQPQALVQSNGTVDVFWRGNDTLLWHEWFVGGAWHGPERLGGPLVADPSAVLTGNGRIDVFYQGSDGALWDVAYRNAWQRPVLAGSDIRGSQPEALGRSDGSADVFWRGRDGGLWTTTRMSANGPWSGLHPLGGALAGDPSPVNTTSGRVEVVYQGSNGSLWHQTEVSGRWSAPANLGAGRLGGPPIATGQAGGTVDVFWLGGDQGLWHEWFVGGRWYGPQRMAGGVSGTPAATVQPSGVIDVFYNSAQSLGHLWYVGGRWHGPELLGGQLG